MKLSSAWNWQLGIGILEDNVFGNTVTEPAPEPEVEKRREPRLSFSLPVKCRSKGKSLSSWFPARSIDVSRNGVRLSLNRSLPVGTPVELDVKLPEIQKAVRLEGVIVWAHPSVNDAGGMECGIAFKNLRRLSNREKFMYFMADRICSLAHHNARGYGCRIASSEKDLDTAYRLVYREYAAKSYCESHPSKMHYGTYNLFPDSRTFMLERNENFLGTVSLIPDNPAGLPLDAIFNKEIRPLRQPGRRLAEVSLLALDRTAFDKKTFSLTDFQKLTASFRLFKIMFDYARLNAGITDLVIGMHPKHKELYRYLTFETLGPVRSYPGAQGKPALLMHMDILHTFQTVPVTKGAGSYFLKDVLCQEEPTDGFKWDTASVRRFLFGRKEVIRGANAAQRIYLAECYPGLFPVEEAS